jgi:hypothetical protein
MILDRRAKRRMLLLFAFTACCYAVWVWAKCTVFYSFEDGGVTLTTEMIERKHLLIRIRSISGFASFASTWCFVGAMFYLRFLRPPTPIPSHKRSVN